MAADGERRSRLVERLLSPAVQVPLPRNATEVGPRLTDAQVARVFTDHVPGVCGFLFREQRGVYALKFLQLAYRQGLQAFAGTNVNDHLTSLMRVIVHHGYDSGAVASRYLAEVADAFKDCQAVQARVIERIGLQLLGVEESFAGLVTRLVGDYKSVAVRMLAVERLTAGFAVDRDANPTHYVNRLTADLGTVLGLDADDVRRAELDAHARSRFTALREGEVTSAATRCRKLFDLEAFLGALVAEINSFGTESSAVSLPRLFLDWASSNLSQKHAVFEDTCMRVQIDTSFAYFVVEAIFLGRPSVTDGATFRGVRIRDLFQHPQAQA
eukprot:TRINITY_DN38505_c0_g1_i1.p1 TRINITY_DN38505_c0_g1~~TRINITY_DN38505_c0_g1_i1.p1  ORF type:complete len:342 (+),score=57.59 TRINITY_DN38505_c0_g1_i1:48-1028(+)